MSALMRSTCGLLGLVCDIGGLLLDPISSEPPSLMSVPRPAMLVAIVIAPGAGFATI
jgi:hypothetical protein